MAEYNYKARDNFGKLTLGAMSAESEDAVVEKLKLAGLIPIMVEKSSGHAAGLTGVLERFRRVKSSQLNMFTRQFAVLQKAGVNVVASLNALRDQADNNVLKKTFEEIAADIKKGESLSTSMAKHPQFFGALYINMLKAGEESGTITEVLDRLADLGDYNDKVNSRIKAATRYPLIVVCAIIVAFLILTILIVPRFAKIYGSAGVALPIPTMILIGANYAINRYWWLVLLIGAGIFFAVNKFINTKKGRFFWDGLTLKLPVFGNLFTKIIMGRFARVTGTLMHTGVPILHVLDLASGGVGNVVIVQAIDSLKTGVQEGKGMAQSMKASGVFPPIVVQMVSVGEDTGKVDELLLHVADYYDMQVGFMVDNLTTLIEPMLLLVLGCGVLTMALGIFLPMWNLMSIFTKK